MESTEPVRLAEVVAFWILAEKRAILGKSCFDSFRFDSGGDGGSNGRQWLAQVKSYVCVQKCGNLWTEIRVGPAHPLLSIASKPAPGKSRSPATVGCAEAQASPTPDGSG